MARFTLIFRWLVGLAFFCGPAGLGHASTPVFRNGHRLLPVIVAAGASPEEHAAAAELARVLGVMSGLAWPVRQEGWFGGKGFYVGRTRTGARRFPPLKPATDLLAPKAGEIGPDGFRIRSRDGNVFIEGATPEATGYAVAWLLQREGGVRWYAPGATGEIVPQRKEWTLPDLDLTREPAYVSREIYDLGGAEGNGWAGHNGLHGRLEFSHALNRVIPPQSLATHPDWAPVLRGRRYRPGPADDCNWQPNLALPAVAEHAAQAAATAFAREPGRASFSLAMNDTVCFDQSALTRTIVEPLRYFRGMPDYSPLVFTFMNRAAESLAARNPSRYLGCLAYFWCENVPPFPVNAQVMPYVTTDRSQFYDQAYRAADLALMSRWGASGVKAFGLWEYAEGGNFLIPRQPLGALAESVREGWHRGARGYFAEVGAQWGYDAFKVWMLARLLWEPDRSPTELADDFYAGYYGPAAGPMRRFFERCEAQWMAQPGPPYWLKFYQQEDQALIFPPEACAELRALLAAAERAAANDPAVAARVARTSRAFAVTESYVAFDAERRQLAALAPVESKPELLGEKSLAASMRRLLRARADFEKALAEAGRGVLPALTRLEPGTFLRNDPVPRLLWLAGRNDPLAPQRLLAAAGGEAGRWGPWQALAEALAGGKLLSAPSRLANSSFAEVEPEGEVPRFLYPRSGPLPAGWFFRGMPAENYRATLTEPGAEGARVLRIEGQWDAQLYQWQPAEPGRIYLATARVRGQSSPGNDSALYLSFLDKDKNRAAASGKQSMPKGLTGEPQTLVVADRAPANAAWVGCSFALTRQVAGDWVELGPVELRDVKGEPGK